MSWQSHEYKLLDHQLLLHPLKAIYLKDQHTLLIADLHLGKARHFRKAGFPVPQAVGDANFDKLISLFLEFKPTRVIFLGDLFHSDFNAEWPSFVDLMGRFPNIQFELVRGNHDILSADLYQEAQMKVHQDQFIIGRLLLTHEPLEEIPECFYNLAGHIHPCVHLSGGGRQRMRLACFHFGKNAGLLPAFGEFTGMAKIEVKKTDRVFVIGEDRVIPV